MSEPASTKGESDAPEVGVSGVQVHDARLVAAMRVHGLTHILTFNTSDFARFPGITVVHARDVGGSTATT